MNNNTMLISAFAIAKANEAMINAIKETVLVSDELKRTYNENLKRELKRLSEQNPEFAEAFEKANQVAQE